LENDRYMKTGNCAHCELKSNMYGAQARAKAQFEKARMQHSLQEHLHGLHPRRSHAAYWPPIHRGHPVPPHPVDILPEPHLQAESTNSSHGSGVITRIKGAVKAVNPLHMMSGALPAHAPPDEEAAVGDPPALASLHGQTIAEPPPAPGAWDRFKKVAWQAAPYVGAAAAVGGAIAARPDLAAQYAGQAVGLAQAAPGAALGAVQAAGGAVQAAGGAVGGAALGAARGVVAAPGAALGAAQDAGDAVGGAAVDVLTGVRGALLAPPRAALGALQGAGGAVLGAAQGAGGVALDAAQGAAGVAQGAAGVAQGAAAGAAQGVRGAAQGVWGGIAAVPGAFRRANDWVKDRWDPPDPTRVYGAVGAPDPVGPARPQPA
jgi:hypothetical protein